MVSSKTPCNLAQNKNSNEEEKVKLKEKSLFYQHRRNNSNQQSFNELEKVVENQNMLLPKFKTTFNNYVDEREELDQISERQGKLCNEAIKYCFLV